MRAKQEAKASSRTWLLKLCVAPGPMFSVTLRLHPSIHSLIRPSTLGRNDQCSKLTSNDSSGLERYLRACLSKHFDGCPSGFRKTRTCSPLIQASSLIGTTFQSSTDTYLSMSKTLQFLSN